MSDDTRHDIRTLLKSFGIQADEALTAHAAAFVGDGPLRVRITLEDVSDYGAVQPDEQLLIHVEGEIRTVADS